MTGSALGAPVPQDARGTHERLAVWPYRHLDVPALRRGGRHPIPIRELVLKVHQRCNIACDYCYVYESPDASWRDRPATMDSQIWAAAIDRLADHVVRHGLTRVRLSLHGGEPLLYGTDRIARLVDYARQTIPAGCSVDVNIQTNATLLTASVLERLIGLDVSIGVSLDGTETDHDRHRRTRTGHGTYAAAARALELMRRPEYYPAFAGILCTIAPDTDPVATFQSIAAFAPPMIDFLLPHANWDRPPDRGRFAPWLAAAFDHWFDGPSVLRVRLFEDIMALLLGGAGQSEQVGLSPLATVVVESDGAIEQIDALKSAYPGACATGRNVRRDDLDDVLTDPGVVARQIGALALSDTCRTCPVQHVCGGGHYAHRFRTGDGYRNPSVYCDDMRALIDHIAGRISTALPRPAGGGIR